MPKKVFLPKKFFVINLFNQSNYPILNTIVASEQMCSGKIFCFKFTLRTFLVISPITKLDFKTLITFYKVYWVFGIAVKWFANVMNFVRISLSKSWTFFHQLTKLTKTPFPTTWTRITTSILGKTDLNNDLNNAWLYQMLFVQW